MPHFDGTITLGSIISACAIIGAVVVFFVRIGEIQSQQTEIIKALRHEFDLHEGKDDIRFERLETRIIDLVSGLQRLVGRMEVFRALPREDQR